MDLFISATLYIEFVLDYPGDGRTVAITASMRLMAFLVFR